MFLLRRVLLRCGLTATDVLHLATSATLGGDDDELRAFPLPAHGHAAGSRPRDPWAASAVRAVACVRQRPTRRSTRGARRQPPSRRRRGRCVVDTGQGDWRRLHGADRGWPVVGGLARHGAPAVRPARRAWSATPSGRTRREGVASRRPIERRRHRRAAALDVNGSVGAGCSAARAPAAPAAARPGRFGPLPERRLLRPGATEEDQMRRCPGCPWRPMSLVLLGCPADRALRELRARGTHRPAGTREIRAAACSEPRYKTNRAGSTRPAARVLRPCTGGSGGAPRTVRWERAACACARCRRSTRTRRTRRAAPTNHSSRSRAAPGCC